MRTLERPVHPARRRVELGAADACRDTVTALTRENERLRAELRAREEELRSSRARIVQAADAARRRLERDLHDGAQQRLVAFALDLRRLLARVEGTDVAPVVAQLGDELAAALAELRELARGIHPVVLTDRGLAPALQGLADRAPLPVLVDVEAIGRPRPHVEAAAYFVVAEALTNVARHAEAGEAHVEVRRRGEHLVVTVTDDGVGGADTARGTGLLGLRDRLAALEGTLAIDSPAGAGTRLSAVIPSQPSPAAASATGESRHRRQPIPQLIGEPT
jgi:signal transduction histidine kinase